MIHDYASNITREQFELIREDVEWTFSWLENYRRQWKNCERTLENSRQVLSLMVMLPAP